MYCLKQNFYLLFFCGYLKFSKSYQSICKENTVQPEQLFEKLGNILAGKPKATVLKS